MVMLTVSLTNTDIFEFVAVFLVFIAICSFLLIWRYIRYKETVALAEKGVLKSEQIREGGNNSLRWGVILICVGTAICVGVTVADQLAAEFLGLLPISLGVALLIIRNIGQKEKLQKLDDERRRPKWEE